MEILWALLWPEEEWAADPPTEFDHLVGSLHWNLVTLSPDSDSSHCAQFRPNPLELCLNPAKNRMYVFFLGGVDRPRFVLRKIPTAI